MRVLHTSDWHLGRNLHGTDLTPAFEMWADHVVELAATRDIDVVLVSGDVYDRSVPPVHMVDLLSRTLARLLDHTSVILTPGNHDAPKRLGFASGLLREGLHIISESLTATKPVEVKRDGDVIGLVYALPYLNPDVERYQLSDDPDVPLERSHTSVFNAVLGKIREDRRSRPENLPTVLMAHAFVVGGEESSSERDISIGGVDSVPSSVFRNEDCPPFDYVALGHLHGPQVVGQESGVHMRYSGSPIAFSFSEENHKKSSVIIEFGNSGDEPVMELVPASVFRPLTTIRGTLEELLSDEYLHARDHFVRAYITDDERPDNMLLRLRSAFDHLLECQHETVYRGTSGVELTRTRTNPLEILHEFFDDAGGRPLDDEEKGLVEQAWLETVRREG